VVELVFPPAVGSLAVFGVALLLDLHPQSQLPTVEPPQTRYPTPSAFAYRAFFDAIVLPGNPGFISVFVARWVLFLTPLNSIANFLAFGVGMGMPLLAFALVSEPWRDRVLGLLTDDRRLVDAATGGILLAISVSSLFDRGRGRRFVPNGRPAVVPPLAYSPSSRPRTRCWISLVPSPISMSLASR
jgi:cytochrome c-type biogenesis protein